MRYRVTSVIILQTNSNSTKSCIYTLKNNDASFVGLAYRVCILTIDASAGQQPGCQRHPIPNDPIAN